MDIMATLHHGVVVDPTDADAVAAALLRILTAPSTWDDMSTSGVKNIMVGAGARGPPPGWAGRAAATYWRPVQRRGLQGPGSPLHPPCARSLELLATQLPPCPPCQAYSWPSHCKKYLESIEVEKRTIKSTKVGGEAAWGLKLRGHCGWRRVWVACRLRCTCTRPDCFAVVARCSVAHAACCALVCPLPCCRLRLPSSPASPCSGPSLPSLPAEA